MIAALLGFVAPFIPDMIGIGQQALNDRNERKMLELRMAHAAQEHDWRMGEIHAGADIAEMKAVRRPHKSYGVQLLDKASNSRDMVWRWSFNCVFLAFSFLDWIISSVRPAISYWAFGLYAATKTAALLHIQSITGDFATTFMNDAAFTQFDQDMLIMILAFWFGDRARRRAKAGQ